ncbi:hypothetical protein HYR54_09990 [Candidatus Acetothermia bacterium]|nr:hypothetical protein [Candidatus Acetothermia bacterium]
MKKVADRVAAEEKTYRKGTQRARERSIMYTITKNFQTMLAGLALFGIMFGGSSSVLAHTPGADVAKTGVQNEHNSILHDAVPTSSGSDPVVRFVYLIPSDKESRKDYSLAIEAAAKHLQIWYRNQMGNGKTFELQGPVVEARSTSHTAAWYSTHNSGSDYKYWFWDNVLADGFELTGGKFDDSGSRWIYYIDADPGCGNNVEQVGGAGTHGVAELPANDLRGLMGEGNKSPCVGNTPDNAPPCRWVGGLGHELGHSFELPHPPGCDPGSSGPCTDPNSLLWTGYAIYPNTYLRQEDKDTLNQSPFFSAMDLTTELSDCDQIGDEVRWIILLDKLKTDIFDIQQKLTALAAKELQELEVLIRKLLDNRLLQLVQNLKTQILNVVQTLGNLVQAANLQSAKAQITLLSNSTATLSNALNALKQQVSKLKKQTELQQWMKKLDEQLQPLWSLPANLQTKINEIAIGKQLPTAISGDVNGDGLVNEADLTKLDAAIAGMSSLSADEFSRADVAKTCGDQSAKELKKDRQAIAKFIEQTKKIGKRAKPVKDQCHGVLIGQPLSSPKASSSDVQKFSLQAGIALSAGLRETSLQVEIFGLNGTKVCDLSGDSNDLSAQFAHISRALANGIYLARVTVRAADGSILRTEVQKIGIVR